MKDFIKRTNNPCESYNFRYNEIFHTAGRSVRLYEWVKITQEEEQLNDVRRGRRRQAPRKGSIIPEIPEEYKKFKKQLERQMKKKRRRNRPFFADALFS